MKNYKNILNGPTKKASQVIVENALGAFFEKVQTPAVLITVSALKMKRITRARLKSSLPQLRDSVELELTHLVDAGVFVIKGNYAPSEKLIDSVVEAKKNYPPEKVLKSTIESAAKKYRSKLMQNDMEIRPIDKTHIEILYVIEEQIGNFRDLILKQFPQEQKKEVTLKLAYLEYLEFVSYSQNEGYYTHSDISDKVSDKRKNYDSSEEVKSLRITPSHPFIIKNRKMIKKDSKKVNANESKNESNTESVKEDLNLVESVLRSHTSEDLVGLDFSLFNLLRKEEGFIKKDNLFSLFPKREEELNRRLTLHISLELILYSKEKGYSIPKKLAEEMNEAYQLKIISAIKKHLRNMDMPENHFSVSSMGNSIMFILGDGEKTQDEIEALFSKEKGKVEDTLNRLTGLVMVKHTRKNKFCYTNCFEDCFS